MTPQSLSYHATGVDVKFNEEHDGRIMAALSKTQIDKLGERLKEGSASQDDLRMLDDYRDSFSDVLMPVLEVLRRHGFEPTSRIAKTTQSIVGKLQREKTLRLSRMQDIAGCRVIVHDITEQDQFVATLQRDFPDSNVIDRRQKPSHNYRAVHVIAKISGKLVEIQIRTPLQHLWAKVSEQLSDVIDREIKYGGGSESWQATLTNAAQAINMYEICQKELPVKKQSLQEDSPQYNEKKRLHEEAEQTLKLCEDGLTRILHGALEELKEQRS